MPTLRDELMQMAVARLETTETDIEKAAALTDCGDSLAFLDLIAEAEKTFKIQISNEELESMNSFDDFVRVVENLASTTCTTL